MDSARSKSGETSASSYLTQTDRDANPLLSTSIFKGAAAYLTETTSYFTSCFPDLTADDDDNDHDHHHRHDGGGRAGTTLFEGLIERAWRIVHGSASDIGWLERAEGLPPVEDGTDQFTQLLDSIRHGVHTLPDSMVYLLVPGLFSNHGPLYFVSTRLHFSRMGLVCHIAKIHSEASVEANAVEIKDCVEEIYWGSRKRVLLLGHSKGGVDAAAALSLYWPDLRDKVVGLVLTQSPYGGSPIASDILSDFRGITSVLISKVMKGDVRALDDLTYDRRKEFLRHHPLPDDVPVVSFVTQASVSPSVLATLSRVSHAGPGLVSLVVPLAATMAACAQMLRLRYGESSDGLVTCRDAVVPGSVVVRPRLRLDHAWIVYSSVNDGGSEPNASQVCEALLTLLVELSHRKQRELAMKEE